MRSKIADEQLAPLRSRFHHHFSDQSPRPLDLLLPPQHRTKTNATRRLGFEEAFLEPARPTSRSTSLPTDTVDLATLLGTHGRLRGKENQWSF